jgi:hypothetical protein
LTYDAPENVREPRIDDFLQSELRRRGMDEVAAVEAARWLDSAGLLRDSDSRPGLPLRNLLRAGAIAGGDQRPPTKHGRWFVVRVERLQPPAAQPQLPTPGPSGSRREPKARAGLPMRRRRLPRTPEPEDGRAALKPTDLAHALRQEPRTVVDARRTPQAGGLPAGGGIYAWWMSPGAIPSVTGPPHPEAEIELLYVGIAPRNAASPATLRSRVLGQHLGGNIGSSTFRQSLAALLFEAQGWTTTWSGSRSQLIPEDNRALSEWQNRYLFLTWVEHPRPWDVEQQVMVLVQPPLNLAGNASHSLHRRLTELRAKLRATPRL